MLSGPKWNAALYIDERANKEQNDSLITIYSGQEEVFLLLLLTLLARCWV